MIKVSHKGKFKETESFFNRIEDGAFLDILKRIGEEGVESLEEYTPKRTGLTASSWSYKIENTKSGKSIVWTNSNRSGNISVAMLIFYGHGMPSGYYVKGIDYINPALKPVFEKFGMEAWKVVIANA